MNVDRTIRTDRRASLSLEGQWHGPGRIANTRAPFAPEPEPQDHWWQYRPSPDFIASLITLGIVAGLWVYALAVFL